MGGGRERGWGGCRGETRVGGLRGEGGRRQVLLSQLICGEAEEEKELVEGWYDWKGLGKPDGRWAVYYKAIS